MLNGIKFGLFSIGTLAFFVCVFLAIKNPDLVDVPGQQRQELSDNPLRKWDKTLSWIMWFGWGCAGVAYYLDRTGVFES